MNAAAGPGHIARLFHHRWTVPALARLDALGGGARFVVLVHELAVNRASLRSALAALTESGLVARNPGYGHPLRPEYVLTDAGRRVAPECLRYMKVVARPPSKDVAHRKWTAALLLAIRSGNHRFNAIQAALQTITPRALTQALRSLDEAGLVFRRIEDGYPPRAEYFLSKPGARVAAAVARIAASLEKPRASSGDDRRRARGGGAR